MTKPLFLLQPQKFSTENIETALVCPICDEAFKKEFPIDLEVEEENLEDLDR